MINGKAITFDTLFAEGGRRRVARTPRLGLPFYAARSGPE
jgi:hypothetical protein